LDKSEELCKTQALEKMTKKQEKRGSGIVSLDPGERVFFTGYDPSGLIIEWSINGMRHKVCSRFVKGWIACRVRSQERTSNIGRDTN